MITPTLSARFPHPARAGGHRDLLGLLYWGGTSAGGARSVTSNISLHLRPFDLKLCRHTHTSIDSLFVKKINIFTMLCKSSGMTALSLQMSPKPRSRVGVRNCHAMHFRATQVKSSHADAMKSCRQKKRRSSKPTVTTV